MDKEKKRGLLNEYLPYIPLLFMIIIIFYRGFILLNYSSLYMDDDQALMWNATSAYAHLMIPEPRFWGQNYGSMFEALFAVPLYWLHIPFQYALPFSTMMIGFLPYLFIAVLLYRNGHKLSCCFLLGSYLLMGWQWDILTSLPRSFISGMPFAVCGAVMLNQRKTKHTVFWGGVLATVGAVMTNTAAVVAGMGYLYYLLSIRKNNKHLLWLILGTALGGLYYLLTKNFYEINAEYRLHYVIQMSFSFSMFSNNLERIFTILSDFVFTNTGAVVLIVLAGMIAYCILGKRWKTLVLLAAAILLMLTLLSMGKTDEFAENSILFSQTRMFLCWTYAILLVCYFDLREYGVPNVSLWLKSAALIALIVAVTVGCAVKLMTLKNEINDPNSTLHNSNAVGEYRVDEILKDCASVQETAAALQADVILVRDRRAFSYAFDALYFGDYTVYNSVYDRRTWNYLKMLQKDPHKCVVVEWNPEGITTEYVELTDESVVDYALSRWDSHRRP